MSKLGQQSVHHPPIYEVKMSIHATGSTLTSFGINIEPYPRPAQLTMSVEEGKFIDYFLPTDLMSKLKDRSNAYMDKAIPLAFQQELSEDVKMDENYHARWPGNLEMRYKAIGYVFVKGKHFGFNVKVIDEETYGTSRSLYWDVEDGVGTFYVPDPAFVHKKNLYQSHHENPRMLLVDFARWRLADSTDTCDLRTTRNFGHADEDEDDVDDGADAAQSPAVRAAARSRAVQKLLTPVNLDHHELKVLTLAAYYAFHLEFDAYAAWYCCVVPLIMRANVSQDDVITAYRELKEGGYV